MQTDAIFKWGFRKILGPGDSDLSEDDRKLLTGARRYIEAYNREIRLRFAKKNPALAVHAE